MRSEEEYRAALQLITSGVNDCEIRRRLGIPRSTITSWRRGLSSRSGGRTTGWSGKREVTCFHCTKGWVDERAYAYLLGVYLGDGCLSLLERAVYRLRISCDLRYPQIIDEIANCIVIARGTEKVGFFIAEGCVEVYSDWKHWQCLFPQHGPGRKHERPIELATWQSKIVFAHPADLVRGLIHSDGNRHINRVTRTLPSGTRSYEYPRYMFTNASADILAILTDALDRLGVHWTQTTARVISVARQSDVAVLDAFVGAKS